MVYTILAGRTVAADSDVHTFQFQKIVFTIIPAFNSKARQGCQSLSLLRVAQFQFPEQCAVFVIFGLVD